ncbi:MAG: hypothetical protein WCR80_06040 [Bacilli bacterium]
MEQTTKTIKKEFEFKKLSDLTAKDLKEQGFVIRKVILNKKANKNGFRYSIEVAIDDEFLNVTLMPGGQYLSADRFNLILLTLGLDTKDKLNRIKEKWVINVPTRLVIGKYKDETEYKSLEVLFKQYLYDIHFFTNDQQRIFDNLEKTKNKKFDWVLRPDKIDKVEESIDFVFN